METVDIDHLQAILAVSLTEAVQIDDLSLNPIEDLHMDSFQILDFILAIEDEYGLEFDCFSELSNHMDTIDEMLLFMKDTVQKEIKIGS